MDKLGVINPKEAKGISLDVNMGEKGVWLVGLTNEQQKEVLSWLIKKAGKEEALSAIRVS